MRMPMTAGMTPIAGAGSAKRVKLISVAMTMTRIRGDIEAGETETEAAGSRRTVRSRSRHPATLTPVSTVLTSR
jgi:hypothetical protein